MATHDDNHGQQAESPRSDITDPHIADYAQRLERIGYRLFEHAGREYVILEGDNQVVAHIYPGPEALRKLEREIDDLYAHACPDRSLAATFHDRARSIGETIDVHDVDALEPRVLRPLLERLSEVDDELQRQVAALAMRA